MAKAAPEVDLALLLSQASHVLETELAAGLQGLGLSPRAYYVLGNANGVELTQIRLAELCGLDKTTMVVTMDELERMGLAERKASTIDRRARIVVVTKAGARLVEKARAIVDGIYRKVLAELPSREREAFVGGLARLVDGPLAKPAQCDRPPRRRPIRRSS